MDGPIRQIKFDSSIQAFFVLEGLSAFQILYFRRWTFIVDSKDVKPANRGFRIELADSPLGPG
jgi:hypothetical protein